MDRDVALKALFHTALFMANFLCHDARILFKLYKINLQNNDRKMFERC